MAEHERNAPGRSGDRWSVGARLDPIREIALLRARSFLREPEALFWTFGFPILLAMGLGIAFRDEAETPPAPIGIEVGSAAEVYLPALVASPGVEPRLVDRARAERDLRTGELPLVLTGRDTLVFSYDPARAESREARLLAEAAIQRAAAGDALVPVVDDAERRPGSRYIDWLIPGLIGLNIMSTGMWAMGYGIVEMRQKRQLKRLVATPMRRTDFLLGQIAARLGYLLLEVPPLVLFAWLVFGVRIEGSIAALVFLVLLGAFAFAGISLLASSRARTVEGVSGINNVIMLPMFIFSGVFFTASRFPDAMQPLIAALPLTALNDALRGVYNEGVGLASLGSEIVVLLGWTLVSCALALKLYRWE